MNEEDSGKIFYLGRNHAKAKELLVTVEKTREQETLESVTRYAKRILQKGFEPSTAYDKAVLDQDRNRMAGLSPEQLANMLDKELRTPETYSEMQKFAIAEALLSKLHPDSRS